MRRDCTKCRFFPRKSLSPPAASSAAVAAATEETENPAATFQRVKEIAFEAAGRPTPREAPPRRSRPRPPGLTEAWFC